MAEIDRVRVKSLYSELTGYLETLPKPDRFNGPTRIGKRFNQICDELSEIILTDFKHMKLDETDNDEDFNGYGFDGATLKTSIAGLTARLKSDFGFESTDKTSTPLVITVNQNQQVQVSITPITEVIASTNNVDLKRLLEELKTEVEGNRNPDNARSILSKILDKSWEIFIKVLPYILEKWGQH